MLFAYGSATATAGAVAPAASAGIPTVQRYALNGSDQRARDVILTVVPGLKLPTNQLFKVDPAPGAKYLVETDPRFTNYQTFLGSDYFQQQLQLDPSRLAKRYGDGFEEQRLIDDQVLALTGRRYLSGYSSTEAEYLGLMNAGVAFAQAYQLTPGMSLSAEQMALLTTDIVWLTTQTVTLADGSTTQALIPQVYLRQVRGQGQEQGQGSDLSPSGALMAGSTLLVKTPGQLVNSASLSADSLAVDAADITNSGSITAQRSAYLRASNDLTSTGAIMAGAGAGAGAGTVSLTAGRDIVLQTRTLDSFDSTTAANGSSLSSRTNVDRIATVQAGAELLINAGRDLNVQGASLSAGGELQATAGRDIRISAVQGSYQIDVKTLGGASTQGRTGYISQAATTSQASNLSATNITLTAGTDASQATGDATTSHGNLSITGSDLTASRNISLQGNNVSIEAAKSSQSADIQTVQRRAYNRGAQSDETLVGGNVSAGNNLTVIATGADQRADAGKLTVTGANLTAGTALAPDGSAPADSGRLVLQGRDITVQSADTRHSQTNESYLRGSNLFTTTTATRAASSTVTQAEASTVSGNSVAILGGDLRGDPTSKTGNVTIAGSNIVATGDLSIAAGHNLTITNSANSSQSSSSANEQKSGLMGAGFGVMIGTRVLDQGSQTTSRTANASTVGSVQGNVSLQAGDAYRQIGSNVTAPSGDIAIKAQRVEIAAAQDTQDGQQQQAFRQSGLTIALSSPAVNAAQTASQMTEAAGKTDDSRLKALAAASTLLAAKGAIDATQTALANGDKSGGVQIAITVGGSQSKSSSNQSSSTARGSQVLAGGNLSIEARGAGAESLLSVQGSELKAGGDASLQADGDIRLSAAQNTYSQRSTSASAGGGVGVAIGFTSNGVGVGVTANASASRGKADGSDLSHTNTQVQAGKTLTLQSGGDTQLQGAVASGQQVKAQVGGKLTVESLQDTSTYSSQSSSAAVSGTYGYGAYVSASGSNTQVQAELKSVGQQSGIQAADGGFQIDVKGGTELKGGAISSSQSAVEQNKNRLTSATLVTSDLDNKASFQASSISASVGSNGGSAGALFKSGDQASTTRAGISGAAIVLTDEARQQQLTGQDAATTVASLNRAVLTGKDTSGALAPQADVHQLEDQVQAGAQITQAFGSLAAKAVGDYAASKTAPITEANNYLVLKDAQSSGALDKAGQDTLKQMETQGGYTPEKAQATLKDPQAQQDYENWKEGGNYRVAAHAVAGALNGGLQGAVGAAASASAAPALGELQASISSNLTGAGVDKDSAQVIGKLLSGGAATAIGAAAGGGVTGATAGLNEDFNNRQLHPQEVGWIKSKAKDFAAKEGISEEQATQRLAQQAVKNVDYLWRAQLADGDDASAKAFLAGAQPTFVNDLGEQQKLFTTTGQQLLRPEMLADTADPAFYTKFVQSGISRDMNTGLLKELKDSGIDLKNSAITLGKAVKDNPGVVRNAAWESVKGLPQSVVDGFKETGTAIGEGAAVALNKDLTDKLNVIYGSDVSGMQQAIVAIRIATAVTGAAGTAKAATGAADAVTVAVGKKLDAVLDEKAAQALMKSGGAMDKTGQPLLDMASLSNAQKGVVGDLFGQSTVQQIVPDGQKLARIPGVGENGIDDLYKVSRPDVDYVKIEYKFVGDYKKAGSSSLGSTLDGKQGSDSWFLGSGRLEKSAGDDVATSVDQAVRAGRTETWLVTTRPDGSTELQVLDAYGRPKPIDTSKIVLPNTSLSGAKP